MPTNYTKWDNLEVSDDEDESSTLDKFLALKAAAVAAGKVPEGFSKLAETRPPPPPLVSLPLLAAGQEIFAEGLESPWAATMLPDGSLIMASRSGSLTVMSTEGKVLRELPMVLGLDDLSGVATDGAAVYVADCGQHCVHKLAVADGAPLGIIRGVEPPADPALTPALTPSKWTDRLDHEKEPPLSSLRYPRGIAYSLVEGRPTILVSDSGNRRVLLYDCDSLEPIRSAECTLSAQGLPSDCDSLEPFRSAECTLSAQGLPSDCDSLEPFRSVGYVRSKPVWANPHEERPKAFTLADGGVAQPIGLTVLPERGWLCVVDGHEHRLVVYALADGARHDARTLWNAGALLSRR